MTKGTYIVHNSFALVNLLVGFAVRKLQLFAKRLFCEVLNVKPLKCPIYNDFGVFCFFLVMLFLFHCVLYSVIMYKYALLCVYSYIYA